MLSTTSNSYIYPRTNILVSPNVPGFEPTYSINKSFCGRGQVELQYRPSQLQLRIQLQLQLQLQLQEKKEKRKKKKRKRKKKKRKRKKKDKKERQKTVMSTVDVVYLTRAVGEQPSASHTVGVHNNPNSNSTRTVGEHRSESNSTFLRTPANCRGRWNELFIY